MTCQADIRTEWVEFFFVISANISVWFIPVTGYMCAACQVFVEEKNQKVHAREISHTTSVIRFRRQVCAMMKPLSLLFKHGITQGLL